MPKRSTAGCLSVDADHTSTLVARRRRVRPTMAAMSGP